MPDYVTAVPVSVLEHREPRIYDVISFPSWMWAEARLTGQYKMAVLHPNPRGHYLYPAPVADVTPSPVAVDIYFT